MSQALTGIGTFSQVSKHRLTTVALFRFSTGLTLSSRIPLMFKTVPKASANFENLFAMIDPDKQIESCYRRDTYKWPG